MLQNILQKIFPKQFGDELMKENAVKAKEVISKAEQEAKELTLKAEQEALRVKQDAAREARKTVDEALEIEKRIAKKEEALQQRENDLNRDRGNLENTRKQLENLKKEYDEKREQVLVKLEKISQMSKEDAKSLLLRGWEDKLKGEIAKKIKAAEEEVKQNIDEKAKDLLVDAMRYGATDYVSEFTLSVINLPSEEFKGRIIGKDGRNIRAFELATGVDVDLEEEGVIRLSSFDAIRREIAKRSLEQLIKDGRIQPQRIEEIVHKQRVEVDKVIIKAGEDLAHRCGIYNLPQEIVKLLGKFKFRYSYGQNMILHTLEETRIGIALAHELKADVNTVKLGCILHDIGKVVTDKEGSHVDLGVDLLKKHKFPQKVIDCVAAHHEDIPFPSLEAIIVYIADAVSGGRPGARHEVLQEYLKRIKTIEDIARTKKGVREVYALQAGRELRVIVKPEEINDDESTVLATKIKEELEQKFEVFPGQIKVTIIREFRTEATTKI
jgi:ribonuclease Y